MVSILYAKALVMLVCVSYEFYKTHANTTRSKSAYEQSV